jgi:hypothetical protein
MAEDIREDRRKDGTGTVQRDLMMMMISQYGRGCEKPRKINDNSRPLGREFFPVTTPPPPRI